MVLLCDAIPTPTDELAAIRYFCGNTELRDDLKEHEPRRAAFYKAAVALARAYANIRDELEAAGYSSADRVRIKRQVEHSMQLRDTIRNASGESLDLKAYEADMRHLLDNYIQADEARVISPFEEVGMIDLIVKSGMSAGVSSLPGHMQHNPEVIAETIENNVRSTIIKTRLSDPVNYEKMSALLDDIIADRKSRAIEYEAYLKHIADLARQLVEGPSGDIPDVLKRKPALWAVYNFLQRECNPAAAETRSTGVIAESGISYTADDEATLQLARAAHDAILRVRPDSWRNIGPRENVIKRVLFELLKENDTVERLFPIIKAQTEYEACLSISWGLVTSQLMWCVRISRISI